MNSIDRNRPLSVRLSGMIIAESVSLPFASAQAPVAAEPYPALVSTRFSGLLTPSSVAPPNHQCEANPSNDTPSKQKITQGVNCNEMLERRGIRMSVASFANESFYKRDKSAEVQE